LYTVFEYSNILNRDEDAPFGSESARVDFHRIIAEISDVNER